MPETQHSIFMYAHQKNLPRTKFGLRKQLSWVFFFFCQVLSRTCTPNCQILCTVCMPNVDFCWQLKSSKYKDFVKLTIRYTQDTAYMPNTRHGIPVGPTDRRAFSIGLNRKVPNFWNCIIVRQLASILWYHPYEQRSLCPHLYLTKLAVVMFVYNILPILRRTNWQSLQDHQCVHKPSTGAAICWLWHQIETHIPHKGLIVVVSIDHTCNLCTRLQCWTNTAPSCFSRDILSGEGEAKDLWVIHVCQVKLMYQTRVPSFRSASAWSDKNFSAAFVHTSFQHMLANMLLLGVFGGMLEFRYGPIRIFTVACLSTLGAAFFAGTFAASCSLVSSYYQTCNHD